MKPAARRGLTAHETAYVNRKLRAQHWGRWGTMGASIMLMLVGVSFYAVLIPAGPNDAGLILGMMAVGALGVAASSSSPGVDASPSMNTSP